MTEDISNQPEQGKPISFSILLSRYDVREGVWRYRKERELAVNTIGLFCVMVLIGLFAGAGIIFKFMVMPGLLPWVGLLLGPIVAVSVPILAVRAYWWSEQTSVAYDTNPIYRDFFKYTFLPEGIQLNIGQTEEFLKWEEFFEVYETHAMFILVTKKTRLLFVPKRGLTGPEQEKQIMQLLRKNIAEYSVVRGKKEEFTYSIT